MVMIMDILDIHGPRKPQFCLEMLFFGPPGIGPHAVGALQDWNRPFLHKKRPFLESRRQLSSVFWAFFDLGTSLAEPDLLKTGLNTILVAGGSLDVIESTSFPSPTGLQEPPRPPGDPPGPLPGVLEKIVFFLKTS